MQFRELQFMRTIYAFAAHMSNLLCVYYKSRGNFDGTLNSNAKAIAKYYIRSGMSAQAALAAV